MGNSLYLFAGILIIGWLVGFVYFGVGGIVHILLALAVVAILFRILPVNKIFKQSQY